MTYLSVAARHGLALGAALVLAATLVAVPVSAAKSTKCLVVNASSNTSFAKLQTAVDAASRGDTLRVKGTCVGTTSIAKDLTIAGTSNPGFGPAILDGGNAGRVLTITGGVSVTLSRLWITHGTADFGGGIATILDWSGMNAVTIVDSVITGNRADEGGGIGNEEGVVTLIDSSVRNNTALTAGGIHNSRDNGSLTLEGASSVSGNQASGDAGGIYSDTYGNVVLNDSSSVHHNTAGGHGGAILVMDSVVTLNDSSSVHDNNAGVDGGGLYIMSMMAVVHFNDTSSVSSNSPNNICYAPFPGSIGCLQ